MTAELPSLEAVAVIALCVWRVTHLVVAEDGPWAAISRLRRLAERVVPAGLLACFYCTSVWVAAPFALAFATGWHAQLVLGLAASAGAIVLERVSTRPAPAEVAVPYFESEVSDAGMLRTETRSIVD